MTVSVKRIAFVPGWLEGEGLDQRQCGFGVPISWQLGHAIMAELLANGTLCVSACRKGKGRISANGGWGYGGGAGGRVAISYTASLSSLSMITIEATGGSMISNRYLPGT